MTDLIWGVKSIARAIGRTEDSAYRMLERGYIPGRKVGKQWVASLSALQRIGDPKHQMTPEEAPNDADMSHVCRVQPPPPEENTDKSKGKLASK